MSLMNEGNDMVMPVAPLNYGGGNNGFGFGDGNGWWIILLFLLLIGGGWNNGGFGGNGNGVNGLYPWMNQAELTEGGFRGQMLNDNITSIRDGVTGISTQLCNGFSDTQMAIANLGAGIEQGANTRQIANMQTAFANQTAMRNGFNGLQSQLAQCCCHNHLGTCPTENIVQKEGNATRVADASNTRDIIESQTRGTQAILDKLCSLELDAKNDEIANLRQQVAMKDLAASQVAQNAFIAQGFSNEVDQLYNRLSNCPVPTTPVYGRTPIFTCNGQNNCGCGCGNF